VAALQKLVDPAGAVQWRSARPWASITFSGIRHRLTIECDVASADKLASVLPQADLAIARHFLADLVIVDTRTDPVNAGRASLDLEALLILDPALPTTS
jgi:hypothetical protein